MDKFLTHHEGGIKSASRGMTSTGTGTEFRQHSAHIRGERHARLWKSGEGNTQKWRFGGKLWRRCNAKLKFHCVF